MHHTMICGDSGSNGDTHLFETPAWTSRLGETERIVVLLIFPYACEFRTYCCVQCDTLLNG